VPHRPDAAVAGDSAGQKRPAAAEVWRVIDFSIHLSFLLAAGEAYVELGLSLE
jgi:hypothetical protein